MGVHSLPIDPRSAAAARRLLRDTLSALVSRAPDDGSGDADARRQATQTAVLAVSELISNAVRHANHLLELSVEVSNGILHVAVIDDATGEPVVGLPDARATSGRGLHIVDQIADRWGVERREDRKAVWFEVILTRPSPPTAL